MAITKEKKKQVLDELGQAVGSSQSVVFVHFNGLSVGDTTLLRKTLKENQVGYKVAKKTLLKRVLSDEKIDGDQPALDGEVAIAFGEDLTAPAREVYNFHKSHMDEIEIVGGIFEGRYMNQSEMMEIATIPPTDVLRGMFVNVINAPIQGVAIVLNAIAEKKQA